MVVPGDDGVHHPFLGNWAFHELGAVGQVRQVLHFIGSGVEFFGDFFRGRSIKISVKPLWWCFGVVTVESWEDARYQELRS